jgi:hypothetical protein
VLSGLNRDETRITLSHQAITNHNFRVVIQSSLQVFLRWLPCKETNTTLSNSTDIYCVQECKLFLLWLQASCSWMGLPLAHQTPQAPPTSDNHIISLTCDILISDNTGCWMLDVRNDILPRCRCHCSASPCCLLRHSSQTPWEAARG